MRTYHFKLYTSKRNRKLHRQINAAGLVYNHCIALHKRYYRLFGKSLNMYQLQKHLTKLKKIFRFAYMKEIGSQAVQDITQRIDRAYKLFFHNLKHKIRTAPPSFKKIKKYKSFTLKQSGWKLDEADNSIVIGKQRYRYAKSREIDGKVKILTVKRDALGDIYLYFVCEASENKVLARTGKSVGFDFGLKMFLNASDGKDIASPLFFKQNATAIKRASSILSRKAKGSNNRKKAKLALARLHRKVANQRDNFHWQLASKLVGEYALICLEDLNLKAMQKRFGRKISDLGFADFVNKLKYMAHRTGSSVVEIDRFFPSSQLCSKCGYQNIEIKNLKFREWTCPKCGSTLDRDKNAAINIEREGNKIFSA
ncbi:RNA-guided endonuclease InsQ/TnpB family protein [Selenomonas ruminantium]|uniref:Putative transposase n=1 Tax=Selenomonas ruminantium TaxID=971 RepID=A0A1H0U9L6_SELRU|nr:RNA-guided endonuclease TnpB family protein [Selenomonas ruminantium]SDP62863.1 putative transposase [Selenomonas ruminantium]